MNTFVTQLRWPVSLRVAVVEAARVNRRSMNAEIITRLEVSLAADVMEDGSGLSDFQMHSGLIMAQDRVDLDVAMQTAWAEGPAGLRSRRERVAA